jgi:hypothetical protein
MVNIHQSAYARVQELPINALNALYAISSDLYKRIVAIGIPVRSHVQYSAEGKALDDAAIPVVNGVGVPGGGLGGGGFPIHAYGDGTGCALLSCAYMGVLIPCTLYC